MSEKTIRIPIRSYHLDRLYGPGMPSYVKEGPEEKTLEKPVSQVGVVSVHCWNLGEPDGPYPMKPGERCPGKVADWVPIAHEICQNWIAPVFDAARGAGIPIFHMGNPFYAKKYPSWEKIVSDPELQSNDRPRTKEDRCVRPCDSTAEMLGPGYPGRPWENPDSGFDIAKVVRPVADEPVLLTGVQLNGLCRRMDIDTLFYVGFMADVCLMNVPGAVRDMSGRGYRCVVLRECTTAYEYEDTYLERLMLKAMLRLLEAGMGYTAGAGDFMRAAQQAGQK